MFTEEKKKVSYIFGVLFCLSGANEQKRTFFSLSSFHSLHFFALMPKSIRQQDPTTTQSSFSKWHCIYQQTETTEEKKAHYCTFDWKKCVFIVHPSIYALAATYYYTHLPSICVQGGYYCPVQYGIKGPFLYSSNNVVKRLYFFRVHVYYVLWLPFFAHSPSNIWQLFMPTFP